ncbi:MAG: F0F1 ATP synthase subunit delta [Omnitrophica bacterium]|nr:F0F1 ATP synthase subunit delta [Candidatus Omnitrophota bacterium]
MAIVLLLVLFLVSIFAVLIFILRKILTKNVISATTHLEELNQDYSQKEKEINRRLEESKQKSAELLAVAEKEIQAQKIQIIKDAQDERDRILNEARTQSEEVLQKAEKSRQLLISELDKRIAQEAINRACELVQDNLPQEVKEDVHLRWVQELIESGFTQIDRLHIPKDLKEVKISSAFALNPQQKKDLAKKLKELLKHEVTLKEQVNPKIVAGIIVSIGSLVLDGSFRNKIKLKAKEMDDEAAK